MFKVNGTPTQDLINKFDNDSNIFYRFQNPEYEIVGEYMESWGMIFSSKEEALEEAEDYGYTEENAVLPGKSCMPQFDQIIEWINYYSKDDVLLVFEGADTYETGHDDEYVAEYEQEIAVWSVKDVKDYLYNLEKAI